MSIINEYEDDPYNYEFTIQIHIIHHYTLGFRVHACLLQN